MSRYLVLSVAMGSVLPSSSALKLPGSAKALARREALTSAFALAAAPSASYAALKPCPPGANNCWSAASADKTKLAQWSWPQEQTRTDAVKQLKAVLAAYPQQGQEGVDLGGWKVAEDALETGGYERLEFMSGIGNFAKFFNGGKPFVDDFEVNIEDSGVCIRSSSRVGDSDFGVNAKRINFIAKELRKEGWSAPAVAL